MAEYTPPPKNNIPFHFNTGGYTEPDWDDIALNLTVEEQKSAMASLGAAIRAVQTYQQQTYTFLKYCETYIVGYSQYGVQIIKGKCHYGGIRDLGGTIGGHYPVDLPAWVRGVVYANLGAEILGRESTQEEDLGAIIGGHLPEDLGAWIGAHDPENITAYIRGFDYRDLLANVTGFARQDLAAILNPVPPKDLSAYLKVWPYRNLGGDIYGWDTKDLGAYIVPGGYENLPAIIGGHRPKNIRARIKGWVREATYDLGSYIRGWPNPIDLGAYIRATSRENLSAYLFPIQPVDLPTFIHGWDTKDLGAIISVAQYPWNLPASIVVSGGYKDLPAYTRGMPYAGGLVDLSAYILPTRGRGYLPASLAIVQARNLSAYIDPGKDLANLAATILPKRIRLTAVLSVITMEHSDLSATISIPCFYSNFKDLPTYIRPVFQSNLGAVLNAKGYTYASANLGAKFGYSLNSVVQDKLQINLSITRAGYRTEDKLPIRFALHRAGYSLGATIVPQRMPRDLSAYINGVAVSPYDFETWKLSERVFTTTYSQMEVDYEDVFISFQSIVKDYFYSSGSDVVAPIDKHQHFITKVASYYSPATARRLDRSLHKVRYLNDMRFFATTDEAVRYAIWYVTTNPIEDLRATINAVVPKGISTLSSYIKGTRYFTENNNLTSNINGTTGYSYDVVVSFTDDGVGYLQF